ncbi:MAG: GGDEF domain-containing protein [Treponema sp.]|nr:GGDEF domain-containing protein [Treponema sp.]
MAFEYFNTAIGSCLIIVIIAVDYLRKYNTDKFQRKLLILMLVAVFISALFDFIGLTLEKHPEFFISFFGLPEFTRYEINSILKYNWSFYFIVRNCCYYYGAVFIDYFAHGNRERTKKLFKFVTIFLFLYSLSLIPNFQQGFYFNISRDNVYMPGSLYILQVFISYMSIILILIDISLAPKYIKRNQILLTIFFIMMSAIGAAVDIVLRTTNLMWPCVTAAILYMYFFIIRADSKFDTLTGIGNRNNFYEYINKLSKESEKREYTFVKIDLLHLTRINESFGFLEGNNALRDVSTIIKSCIRHTDYAVRYGGDEFIIITTAEKDIKNIIERIFNAMAVQNNKKTRPYQLEINCGYDFFTTSSGWDIQDFLASLDSKMQETKCSKN